MSAAAPTLAAIGAITAAAEKRIVRHFLERGATAPDRAVGFEPRRSFEKNRLRYLLKRGVVREAAPGLFHFDEEGWRSLRSKRRRTLLWILVVLAILMVSVALISSGRS